MPLAPQLSRLGADLDLCVACPLCYTSPTLLVFQHPFPYPALPPSPLPTDLFNSPALLITLSPPSSKKKKQRNWNGLGRRREESGEGGCCCGGGGVRGGGSDKRFLQEPGVWKWRPLGPCLALRMVVQESDLWK